MKRWVFFSVLFFAAATFCRGEPATRVFDAGGVLIRVPESVASNVGHVAPGPVLGVAQAAGEAGTNLHWIGTSRLFSPRKRIASLCVDEGEGRTAGGQRTIRVTYVWEDGSRYVARIREGTVDAPARLDEEIAGLAAQDRVRVETAWIGFRPTFRAFPTVHGEIERGMMVPLDVPVDGERTAGWAEVPAVEMDARLIPCNPIDGVGRYAAFRDVNTGRTLGLFAGGRWPRRPRYPGVPPFRPAPPVTFRYADGVLQWRWPLRTGRRFTALVWGDDPDGTLVQGLDARWGGVDPVRRAEWQLSYSENAARPPVLFPGGPLPDPVEALRGNITGRNVYYRLIHGYNRSLPVMSPTERDRVDRHILRAAYRCADQPFLPLIGSDGRWGAGRVADHMGILPAAALFMPEHPRAAEWLAQYEKFVELAAWLRTERDRGDGAGRGGAWHDGDREQAWAFLRAVVWGNFAGLHVDGRNRLANPSLARFGAGCVATLTAPVDGQRRQAPGNGSGVAVGAPLPFEAWMLGQWLRHYRPLVAEHLLWAARRSAKPYGRPGLGGETIRAAQPDNRGTPATLRSGIHAGRGVVLRSGVETPREVSIHLSRGALTYCAAGSIYGGRVADARRDGAGELLCNFRVHGNARRPDGGAGGAANALWDVGLVQAAESVDGPGGGRRVCLVGTDYAVVLDRAPDGASTRFTWAVPRGGTRPELRFLRGNEHITRVGAPPGTEAFVREGDDGDCLALITHRRDLDIRRTEYGCKVEREQATDLVFCSSTPRRVRGWGYRFEGEQGVVRRWRDGMRVLTILRGRKIRSGDVQFEVAGTNVAMSLTCREAPECEGWFAAPGGGDAVLRLRRLSEKDGKLYIDGRVHRAEKRDNAIRFELPPGRHRWQWTTGRPRPARPTVVRAHAGPDGAAVVWRPAAGGRTYRVERSDDNGRTWQVAAEQAAQEGDAAERRVTVPLPSGAAKVHVRVTAWNGPVAGDSSPPFPVYISTGPPRAPDGLRCFPMRDRVRVVWGRVLGARAYCLYRRRAGAKVREWTRVFKGRALEFTDGGARGAVPAFAMPGAALNADRPYEGAVYQYAVAVVDANGEGPKSTPMTTHPADWLNWYPVGVE